VLGTVLCACVCSYPGNPKKLENRVSLFPRGMGDSQIGCHKVSDMFVLQGHANSELVSECPKLFLPLLCQWRSVVVYLPFGPSIVWALVYYIVYVPKGLGFVEH
jgi:hypothetical protein